MVCSPNSKTDFFDIIVGILRSDTLVSYMFIIFLGCQLRIDLIKEISFTQKKQEADDIPQKLWLTQTTQMI